MTKEALVKTLTTVIPVEAGIQERLKPWIPGCASLARNDTEGVLQEALKVKGKRKNA